MFNLIYIDNKLKFVIVFQFIANINNCFDSKKIVKLSNYNKNNYIIDLVFNIESSHNSLYFLLKKKLNVFQNYLHNNKTFKKIRCLISFVETLVMFVSKKNKNFRFCVDYCDLNVITIKNCYFLFFINKTLNCLIDVYYFTKLNFKNVLSHLYSCKKQIKNCVSNSL